MERLFHSKSHFWLCSCKPSANHESMWHISALQAFCALGDQLCHTMTVGMQMCTVRQCTLTGHGSHVQKQNISQAAVCCRYFLPFSLQGLEAHITLSSSSQIHRNKKKNQGETRLVVLFFFFFFPLSALWSTLSRPIEQVAKYSQSELVPALLQRY